MLEELQKMIEDAVKAYEAASNVHQCDDEGAEYNAAWHEGFVAGLEAAAAVLHTSCAKRD